MSSKDITERLQDYARDYTTTTYHDDLIREAVTEIAELRQQITLLREVLTRLNKADTSTLLWIFDVNAITADALAATALKEEWK